MNHECIPTQAGGVPRWDCGRLYVEPSHNRDAHPIATRLRPADRAEISAVTRQSPLQVLVDGINESNICFTIKRSSDGRPCGVFGAGGGGGGHPQDTRSGMVWLLGTDDLTLNGRTFLRYSRSFLNEMKKHYSFLYNVIDARNSVHIRWLGWMGFDFIKVIPRWGVEHRKFIMFSKTI
jgi:hypothetical protein